MLALVGVVSLVGCKPSFYILMNFKVRFDGA